MNLQVMRGPERWGRENTVPRLVVEDGDVTVKTETTDSYASKIAVKPKL